MKQGDGEPLKNLGFKLPAHSLLSEKSICVAYCNQGDWELREWPVPLIRSFSSSLLVHRIVLGLIKRLEPRRPLQGETILHQALTSRLASADRKRWTAQESAQPEAGILCAPPGIKLPSELQELPGSFRALALRERLLMPAGVRIWGAASRGTPGLCPEAMEIEITWKIPVDAALVLLWPPARCCSFHPWDRALIYSCLSQTLLLGRKAII